MKELLRIGKVVLGWLLLVLGLIFLPMPPPLAFGGVMAILGIALLVTSSGQFRRVVQGLRTRWPGFSEWLESLSARLPAPLARVLRATRPRQPRPAVPRKSPAE